MSGATRVAAVIGDPARHSLSPAIHNAAFRALDLDWVFLAFEVAAADVAAAIAGVRALGIDGLSVTMPHKDAVVDLVDRLTPTAATLGAVNCIAREGAELVGDNTDGAGFVDALRADEGFDPAGKDCAVIGAGGAARAVVLALAGAGAARVTVVNRTAATAESAAGLAGSVGATASAARVRDADLVVNATPVGMRRIGVGLESDEEKLPVAADYLRAGQLVVDLVYAPPVTPLLAAARAAGATGVNGLGMLVHQAGHAFRRWTNLDPPLAAMSAAVLAEVARGPR